MGERAVACDESNDEHHERASHPYPSTLRAASCFLVAPWLDSVYVLRMTPAEIKALRAELRCSTRDLAQAIGVEQASILSWERGDTFPTKRWVDRMKEVRAAGPSATPTSGMPASAAGPPGTPLAGLADPRVWAIIRKLIVYPELRSRVEELAAAYEDPTDPS